MKLTKKIKINIIISFIILTGFCSVGVVSYNTYSKIIKDDIKNISKLTATNIYSDISNQLTKPIFVALTMANDRFVEDWLKEEKKDLASAEHEKKMTNYLNGLKNKYKYNSVFLVSDYSKIYYHFKGINKVISVNNAHDKWYYDYLKSNLAYSLDVDTDEENHNKLSVFINCRIEDERNKLLGVTGVGLQLNKVQDMLRSYKNDFQLDAMLFDKNGVVQVHPDSDRIEKTNVFQYKVLKQNKDSILANKKNISVYRYKDGKSEGYIITRYIEDMDWYLLVRKDTSVLTKSFHVLILKDIIIFLVVISTIIFIINGLVKNNDKKLIRAAKTDVLTGLTNRRGFDEALEKLIHNAKSTENCYIFVFDIDNFKMINDKYGHLAGDHVICEIGNHVKACIKDYGDVFRWGGDEFAGFTINDHEAIEERINVLFDSIQTSKVIQEYKVSISMGITLLQNTDTLDTLLKRADKALYRAKENGKNQYVII